MSIQNESEVAKKRTNALKDDPEKDIKVVASLRDQILDKLMKKLDDLEIGPKVVELWRKGDADRSDWLDKQQSYLREIDEFIEPIYTPALDWSSTIHLPTILTVCKAYHARMFAALWGVDPPFVAKARKGSNADTEMLISELLRYTLKDWCNEYEGVEDELDKWLWMWVTRGDAYLKSRWIKKFTRYQDVDVSQVEDVEMQMDPESGQSVVVPVMRDVEREVSRTEEVFNGPEMVNVPSEDIIIHGGDGNPQKADAVLHRDYLTASELWSYADQKIFLMDAVEEIVKGGKDYKYQDASGALKQQATTQSGKSTVNTEVELDRYEIIESHMRVDVDGSGITSDVIVWVHKRSSRILRATYSRRVTKSGRRPFAKISFHKRADQDHSVGLVELVYSLAKEIDAIHNINVDIGILSSLPFGFYRPTSASLKEEGLPIEPGALIPVDNPQTDIYFPNLGLRTSFGFQEHQALMNQIERLTSISELNFGMQTMQGAARTATGTRALLGESTNNLDIYIRRMSRGWRAALRFQFEMLQDRLPAGFEFRLTGDDGHDYFRQVKTREEICGSYDFDIDANSGNSNKQVQIEQANMIYQATQNPIDLQLGIVTPANRYEAFVNMLKVNGVKDVSKYASRPQNYALTFSPLEMADRTLAGIDVPLNPAMDLQGFVNLAQHLLETDELNGQFGADHVAALTHKMQEAAQMMQAMQSAKANSDMINQQSMNAQASMVPGNMQSPGITQAPAQGEGG